MDILKVIRAEIDADDPNLEFVDVADIVEANLCNFDNSELWELVKSILDEIDRRSRNAAIRRRGDG